MNFPGGLKASSTLTLFHPISNGTIDRKTNRGLTINQKKIKSTSTANITLKPSPSIDTNHHRAGCKYGAPHASKKTREAIMFRNIKRRRINDLYLPAIGAIYKSSLLARFN